MRAEVLSIPFVMCDEHDGKIKAECEKYGLEHMQKPPEAPENVNAENLAHAYITKAYLERASGGNLASLMSLVMQDKAGFSTDKIESGSICSLCRVEIAKPGMAQNWIEGAVAEMARTMNEMGLLPKRH